MEKLLKQYYLEFINYLLDPMFPFLTFDSGQVQISFTVSRYYHHYYLYDIKKIQYRLL